MLVVGVALLARFASVDEEYTQRIDILEANTGIDFGEWPPFFRTSGGGDGEFFAVLAADPLGLQVDSSPTMVYRYARIGFSLGAFLLSVGVDRFVLPALALVGLMSVGAVAYMAFTLRERLGQKAWLLVLNPALYAGFARDTAEPFALALLILCIGWNSRFAAIALGGTRPSYGFAVLGKWRLFFLVALAALGIRVLAATRFSGHFFGGTPGGTFDWPFAAYMAYPSAISIATIVVAVGTVVVGFKQRDWGWVASGILVIVLGGAVAEFSVNVLRAAGMLPVLWAFGPRAQDSVKADLWPLFKDSRRFGKFEPSERRQLAPDLTGSRIEPM